MDFKVLLQTQSFIVAIIFTTAVILWYRINNENPTLYKCRHAINFTLMITFILIIKAFNILPDPQNIRQIIQHLLTAVVALGFFFEIKKVYKTNLLRRKKELGQVMNLDVENPVKEELSRELIRPELRRLGGLRKLINDENEALEKKKEKLEEWEDKLGDLRDDIEIEKKKLAKLNKELEEKGRELKNSEKNLETRKKKVEIKEKNYVKKEQNLNEKRKEIKEINKKVEEEKKEMDKRLKTMKLLEEDIKDQKSDIQKEQEKLEKLKK